MGEKTDETSDEKRCIVCTLENCENHEDKHGKDKKTLIFIEKSRAKHGFRYDYSDVVYVRTKDKVNIICQVHGVFPQLLHNHLKGKGCIDCSGSRKSTTEKFIEKAKEIHGDKYDYSDVIYVRAKDKVNIMCKKHGIFSQTPNNHLNGQGCKKCYGNEKSTTEEFIQKARIKHGDLYHYSSVVYVNCDTKILIICRKHGIFSQTPNNHLNGQGCKKCGLESSGNKQRSTTEEFVEKAKEIHGDRYDYSSVVYVTSREKVDIICGKHGRFCQTPSDHLNGQGCKKCGFESNKNKQRSTTEEFIEKAKEVHGDKYDYSDVIYVNNRIKVNIICGKHGRFCQTPSDHLSGRGCKICGIETMTNKQRSTKEEFIQKARIKHGDKYDYSAVVYVNSKKKVNIICRKHGSFPQEPYSHLSGKGCKKCGESKGEKKLRELLEEKGYELEYQYKVPPFSYRYDIYVPEQNLLIEYDGEQHFDPESYYSKKNNFKQQLGHDLNKTSIALENGYRLLRIPYTEYDLIEPILDAYFEEESDICISRSENPFVEEVYRVHREYVQMALS